jgi:hypothetical protein
MQPRIVAGYFLAVLTPVALCISLFLCYKSMAKAKLVFKLYFVCCFLLLSTTVPFCLVVFTVGSVNSMYLWTQIVMDAAVIFAFASVCVRWSYFLPQGPFRFSVWRLTNDVPIKIAKMMGVLTFLAIVGKVADLAVGPFTHPALVFLCRRSMTIVHVLEALIDISLVSHLFHLLSRNRVGANKQGTHSHKDKQRIGMVLALKAAVVLSAGILPAFNTNNIYTFITTHLIGLYISTDGLFLWVFKDMAMRTVSEKGEFSSFSSTNNPSKSAPVNASLIG